MKIPSNVKVKRGLWNLFPFSKYTAQAIYPNIYFSPKAYRNLTSAKPNPRYLAALIHEQNHLERQRKTGWFLWGLKYLLSPKFRFNEELAAIKASMKYLKKKKLSFNTPKKAKHLSSWLYLWCTSFEKAKKELNRAWKEA